MKKNLFFRRLPGHGFLDDADNQCGDLFKVRQADLVSGVAWLFLFSENIDRKIDHSIGFVFLQFLFQVNFIVDKKAKAYYISGTMKTEGERK
jgi:hypothetical protein